LNVNFNKLTLELNLELNTLGYLLEVLRCGCRSSSKNITHIRCTKIQVFSKLHIIPKNSDIYYLKLIKWYICTIYFISFDAFRRKEQNQTIVLSAGHTSMSYQWDLK